jgi:hypothetical protein
MYLDSLEKGGDGTKTHHSVVKKLGASQASGGFKFGTKEKRGTNGMGE